MLCHGKGFKSPELAVARKWYANTCDEKSDTRCDYCFYNMTRRYPERAIKMHQISQNNKYEYDCDSIHDSYFSTFYLKNMNQEKARNAADSYQIRITSGDHTPLLPVEITPGVAFVEIPNNHAPLAQEACGIQIIPAQNLLKSYYTVDISLNGKKIDIPKIMRSGPTLFDNVPEFCSNLLNKNLHICVIEYTIISNLWMKIVNSRHEMRVEFCASMYDSRFKSPFELFQEQIKTRVDEYEPGEEYIHV